MRLPLIKSIVTFAAATLLNGSLFGQFGDDPDSKAKLAEACAVSGGGNAADYQSYASSLAVTLSQLSSAEQTEVLDGTASGSATGDGESGDGDGGTDNGGGGGEEEEDSGSGGSSPSGWGSGGGISSWFTSNTPADAGNGHVFAVVLDSSQKATSEVSFTNAPITESVVSGEFSLVSLQNKNQQPSATAGTMTQAVDPTGKPIFRAEDNTPRDNATISFKDGKLSFGSESKNSASEGGQK